MGGGGGRSTHELQHARDLVLEGLERPVLANTVSNARSGSSARRAQSVVATCQLHGVNPEAYRADVLARIGTSRNLKSLMPCRRDVPDALAS